MRVMVYTEPASIRQRLEELGLPAAIFQAAGQRGLFARSQTSPFEPKIAAGFTLWSKTIGSLGELAAPYGFSTEAPAGHHLVIDHRKKRAYAVATGDHNVGNGDADQHPRTRVDKGIRTEEGLQENQYELFPELALKFDSYHPLRGYEFWWLLLHVVEETGVLRMEVSRGLMLDKDRCISTWVERVMLEDQSLGGDGLPTRNTNDPDGPDSGEYDVTITRRVG
jgi:hypothetical protein